MTNINKKNLPLLKHSISTIAIMASALIAADTKHAQATPADYFAAEPTIKLDAEFLAKINSITSEIIAEHDLQIAQMEEEKTPPVIADPKIDFDNPASLNEFDDDEMPIEGSNETEETVSSSELQQELLIDTREKVEIKVEKKPIKVENVGIVPMAKPTEFEQDKSGINAAITPPTDRPNFSELDEHYQEIVESGGSLSSEEVNVEKSKIKIKKNSDNAEKAAASFIAKIGKSISKVKGVSAPSIGEKLPEAQDEEDLTASEKFEDDTNAENEIENIEKMLIRLPLHKSKILEFDTKVRDVMVAAPNVVDVKIQTPNMVYIVAKSVGSTNIIFTDKDGKILQRVELSVQLDTLAAQEILSNVLPGENIKVTAANENIILSGSVSNNAAVKNAISLARSFVANDTNVVNMLTVSGEQQVMLKVKVAEMQRSVLKELGFSTQLGPASLGSNSVYTWTPGATALSGGGSGVGALYSGRFNTASGRFTTTLQALENNGLLKTLAEPNMVAVSGETASLLAGGEYPIPVSDSDGQITFEFKPYGVGLSFTPVVLSSGKISLKLATEVSSLSNQTVTTANTSIPAINVRRANTTVEMPSGGSLMIAGLLQNDVISNLSGVPGLKDVPILGALFRSQQFQRNETELVISITALLVQPHDPNEFALPTDGFAPSGDLDRLLLGRLYQAHTLKSLPPTAAEIEGPVGYIMK